MKKLLIALVVIAIIASVVTYYLTNYQEIQEQEIVKLELKIDNLKAEHSPIRFIIREKTEDSITLAAKFYDADGTLIGQVEHKLEGRELSFDFQVVAADGGYLAFPYKIYTDEIAPTDGFDLTSVYDQNGFPQVFAQANLDNTNKQVLSELFAKVKSGEIEKDKNAFGNMVHDVHEIKSFEKDIIYKIITRTKGGIEIIEE